MDKYRRVVSIDSRLNRVQDLDVLLERILLEARQMLNADAGSVYVTVKDELHINFAQNETHQRELPPGSKLIYKFFTIPITNETISGYVALTKRPLMLEDVYDISEDAPYKYNKMYDEISNYRTKSMLTVPLTSSAGSTLGVIQIINKRGKEGEWVPFELDDLTMITHFANSASVALERAHMTRQIILRMIQMAEMRDPKETGTHVNRVAAYAVELYDRWAFKKGIPSSKREHDRDIMRMAAMLHDVGKVAISDIILKKPGRFTDEEREVMKHHTVYGARLFLNEESEFDRIAFLIALRHHENWDGTGYPGHVDVATGEPTKLDKDGNPVGLKGKEIPLVGRIVSLADVYDALRSRRSYKDPWSEEDVLNEINKLKGTKFDPEIVDVFFEVYERLETISKKYSEGTPSIFE